MRLAFVSDFYYPSIGGTQMLCKGIAEWFRDQGHEIEIITSHDPSRGNMGYKVNEVSLSGKYFLEGINKMGYDAIFVFADLTSPSLVHDYSMLSSKTIVIFNLDENVYKWVKNGLVKDLDNRINNLKSFDNKISYCQNAPVNLFLQENDIEYDFIPNFSRDMTTEVGDIITKEKLGIKNKIIFNHSAIETRKNQLNLIKSFNQSDLVDEYSLVLLGSPRGGPYEVEYLKQCLKNKKDNIIFLKGTNNKQIIDTMLNISDVFIMPSIAEGLPLCLLEAMSADLRWVSTPCGGVPKILGNLGCGFVMSDFSLNPEELSCYIRKASELKSPREKWEKHFTIESIMKKYDKILKGE